MSKLVRKTGLRSAGVIAVLLSLSLFSCQAPFGVNQSDGQGYLILGMPQARSTTYATIASWQISAQGPDASLDRTIDASTEEVVFEELAVGTWTFTIEGYDAHSTMLYQVTKDVEIVAGDNTAEFVLELVNGVLLGHWNYDGGSANDLTGRNMVSPGLIGPMASMPPMVNSNNNAQTIQGDGFVVFMPASGTMQEMQGGMVDLGAVDFGPKFTLSCWLWPANSPSYANSKQVILSNQNGSTVTGGLSNGSGFTLSINTYGQTADNTVHFISSNGSISSPEVISSQFNSDLWNHIAVSVDRAAGTVTVWVNGNPTSGTVLTDFAVSGANTRVAAFPDADYDLGIAGCFYSGRMDDWRIYTGVLGPADIRQLFSGVAFAGGSGTAADPFLVASPQQLNSIRNFPAAWFSQQGDIDLGVLPWSDGWQPICHNGALFTGHYDGNNFDISGLRMPSTKTWFDNFGLFGFLTNAVINNVHLSGVDIVCYSGTPSRGALAAQAATSTITHCSATGTIQSGGNVGGLVGQAVNSVISRCFANVAIDAGSNDSSAGGLVGVNKAVAVGGASINESYATGTVQGTGTTIYFGGLVGTNDDGGYGANIANCYSHGAVAAVSGTRGGLLGANLGSLASVDKCYATGTISGTVSCGLTGQNGGSMTGCFWDSETSGQTSSPGGIIKTTAEMKTASTFSAWDSATIWNIQDGSYPTLRW